jgi:hypothetical protein
MRGEIQQPRTAGPGHDERDSGPQDRPADLELATRWPLSPRAMGEFLIRATGGRLGRETSSRRICTGQRDMSAAALFPWFPPYDTADVSGIRWIEVIRGL